MGISDTTVEAGSDKRHHHKRHHSKHHSKHKQGHHGNDSSSDHKPKHKHRHHKHHHHKHNSHKKHRHKTKVALDEAAIQSALEILEADALEAVKDQVATELNPETVELMLAACTSESTSEDSSSSSESEGEEGRKTTTAETTTLRIREVLASNTQQQSPLSDSIPSGQTDSGTTLAREPSPPVSCEDVIGTGNAVQEERRSSSKRESDSESDSEDESESGATFGAPKPTSERRNSKTIQIKIHRTKLPGKEEESYSNSVPSSPQELKSKENTDRDSESLNNRDRETKSITTGSSKITYVNLKAKKLDSDSRKAGRGSGGEKRKAAASDDSGDERPRSSSPEGRQQDRERRNRSSKRRSSRHRRSSSVSVSRSRSRSQSPHAGRHRHRSHRYRSKSRSRSRPRSSHSRRRSSRYRRSRSRSRSRSRRHRRSRSRSYIRHSSRSRSRSRSHSRSRRRYSCSSSRRRSPRRRHSYHHHSRSRSPYRSRRRRYSSRSRSRSRRSRSYSRSRSKSHSRSSSRGRNRDGEKPASEASVVKAISTAAAAIEATVADLKDPKKAHIAQLTAFCQELQEKQAREWEEGEEEEGGGAEPESEVRAPFELNPTPAYQPGLIFHNNAWKTANQIAAEMDAHIDEKPVEEKFPVSSGLPHKSTTGGIPDTQSVNAFTRLQPVSVGDLVVKRLEATRKVQQNPADYEAHRTLAEIEQQTQQWAQSKLKPGRFTGQASLTAMSMKEHNTGQQAWAKKDMFLHLAPVMGGFGMKMLKKMGWQEGQPLGKMGEGHVEPIAVQVKVNRSGLSSIADKQPPVIPAAALQSVSARGAHLVQGKHPVSALQEICAKKKWDPPHYEMVDVAGPAHKKTFLFRVTVPLGTFQPAVASNNKKVAKAQAALAALQGLGLSSGSVEYSAS